jgi:hypothetical protein
MESGGWLAGQNGANGDVSPGCDRRLPQMTRDHASAQGGNPDDHEVLLS